MAVTDVEHVGQSGEISGLRDEVALLVELSEDQEALQKVLLLLDPPSDLDRPTYESRMAWIESQLPEWDQSIEEYRSGVKGCSIAEMLAVFTDDDASV